MGNRLQVPRLNGTLKQHRYQSKERASMESFLETTKRMEIDNNTYDAED